MHFLPGANQVLGNQPDAPRCTELAGRLRETPFSALHGCKTYHHHYSVAYDAFLARRTPATRFLEINQVPLAAAELR